VASWLWPTRLDEAIAERARLGEAALVVGGGVWATLLLNQALVQPEAFLALGRVAGLDAVSLEWDGTLRLGATARLSDVARDPLVRANYAWLADTYGGVANERVRNQGTVGGNLAEADYASDPPTALAALGATVRLAGPGGERDVPIGEFLLGHYQTALGPDELLVEVRIPPQPAGARGQYLRFVSRSSEDRPCAGVAVVAGGGGLSVAIGAVEAVPRGFRFEAGIEPGEAGEACAAAVDPLSDLRGSAEYRRRLVRALVPRAIKAAVGDG
jgi:carbon-monoxide dehydrogenase medium subunit